MLVFLVVLTTLTVFVQASPLVCAAVGETELSPACPKLKKVCAPSSTTSLTSLTTPNIAKIYSSCLVEVQAPYLSLSDDAQAAEAKVECPSNPKWYIAKRKAACERHASIKKACSALNQLPRDGGVACSKDEDCVLPLKQCWASCRHCFPVATCAASPDVAPRGEKNCLTSQSSASTFSSGTWLAWVVVLMTVFVHL